MTPPTLSAPDSRRAATRRGMYAVGYTTCASMRMMTSPRAAASPAFSAAGVVCRGLSMRRIALWRAAWAATISRVRSRLMPSATITSKRDGG